MNTDVSLSRFTRDNYDLRYDDMIDKEDVTVVIPTLNEALGIGKVIKDVLNAGFPKILVVDGYSSDNTVDVITRFDVKFIQQHGNGKTGAIKTCIDHVDTPYFIVIDGDTTYDPMDIDKFLPHAKHFNLIIGARETGRDNISKINRFGNWVINIFFNLMFGTQLSDVCSGLYLLNTTFAKNLIFETQGFDVEVEIAAQAADSGSITEVPISYSKRVGIQKLNPWKDGFAIMTSIVKLARNYNSIILYTFLTSLTMLPALGILAWVYLETLQSRWHNGFALLGMLLAIIASQAFTISTMASQQRRLEQRLNKKIKTD